MNDVFFEQVVKKKRTAKDKLNFIITIIMVVLVPLTMLILTYFRVLITYFAIVAIFVFAFGIWLIWFVRSHQNVEFEYQVIQDTLVVSKVIDKRIRKHILKLDIKSLEILEKGGEEGFDGKRIIKVFESCGDKKDKENTFYAVFNHTAYGRCGLLFSPNERILGAMKHYLNKEIVLKLFYHRG